MDTDGDGFANVVNLSILMNPALVQEVLDCAGKS
jgi:hypothetical protein